MKYLLAILLLVNSFVIDGIEISFVGDFIATAYCGCKICCGKWARYKTTAFGYKPREGKTMAADPAVLTPHEYYLVEDSDGNYDNLRFEDTGRLIKQYRVDIYKETHKKAKLFKKPVKIYKVKIKT